MGEGDQKMHPTTHATAGSAPAPVLYMALGLSKKNWRLAFGDGANGADVAARAASGNQPAPFAVP